MRSREAISAVLLVGIGAALALANVWFTAARSTIPLALEGVVATMEMRPEKHPGRDDVFLVKLQSQPAIPVDEAVYRAISIGEQLRKPRWSRRLMHDGQSARLEWSRDCRGMLWAMPAVVAILMATCLTACCQERFGRGSQSGDCRGTYGRT